MATSERKSSPFLESVSDFMAVRRYSSRTISYRSGMVRDVIIV